MAETTEGSAKPESPRPRQEIWVVAALAGTALVCLSALAMALVFILGRSNAAPASTVQNMGNPVINIGAMAPAPASIQRPSEPAKPQANRNAAQDVAAAALPGVLATPTAVAGKREKQLVRAETASVPAPSFPTPVVATKYRVRGDAPNLYTGDKALPFPIRYAAGEKKDQPAEVVFGKAPEGVSTLPADVVYSDAGVSAGGLDVQLSHPRKTMVGGAYRAPEGFWFFTTDIRVENKGQSAVAVAPLNFVLHDAEDAKSMGLPEWSSGLPEAPLQTGAVAEGTLSFLAYDGIELKELVLAGPDQPVLIPLAKK